jgi:hypothetical protein
MLAGRGREAASPLSIGVCATSCDSTRKRWRGLSRRGSSENAPHGRWPPLCAAVGRRRLARVEGAGNLAQALAFRVFSLNLTHEVVWDRGRSSRRRGLRTPSNGPPALVHEPLELVDRDQPCPPRHVDGREERQHPPAEGRSTHPEGFCGLPPRVGEPLHLRRHANDGSRGTRHWLERGRRVPLRFRASASLSTTGHAYKRTQTLARIAPMVHLCLACD